MTNSAFPKTTAISMYRACPPGAVPLKPNEFFADIGGVSWGCEPPTSASPASLRAVSTPLYGCPPRIAIFKAAGGGRRKVLNHKGNERHWPGSGRPNWRRTPPGVSSTRYHFMSSEGGGTLTPPLAVTSFRGKSALPTGAVRVCSAASKTGWFLSELLCKPPKVTLNVNLSICRNPSLICSCTFATFCRREVDAKGPVPSASRPMVRSSTLTPGIRQRLFRKWSRF